MAGSTRGGFYPTRRISTSGGAHAPSAHNKLPQDVKRRHFHLFRQGLSGSSASAVVGVSLSCVSLWFINAGSVSFIESSISTRFDGGRESQKGPAAVSGRNAASSRRCLTICG